MSIHEVLASLPEPARLLDLSKALAMLDAVMNPEEPESRYYRFDSEWADGRQLASMDNGSGDQYSIVFAAEGVFARGFAHEAVMNPFARDPARVWPGVLEGVPAPFRSLLSEPSFMREGVFLASTAFWCEGSGAWQAGSFVPPEDAYDPDGSDELFELLLDDEAEAYVALAEEYYEQPIHLGVVRSVYAMQPLTVEAAQRLNPAINVKQMRKEARVIGYPLALRVVR